MRRHSGKVLVALMLTTVAVRGQEPVCNLFKDLKAADGRQLIVTGELIISKDIAAIGPTTAITNTSPISTYGRERCGCGLRPWFPLSSWLVFETLRKKPIACGAKAKR